MTTLGQNPSYAFAAGGAISTADDLAIWDARIGRQACLAASLVLGLRQGGNGRCAKIQSTAADRLSRVTVGGGSNRSSSP